jgi:hypothetical protein
MTGGDGVTMSVCGICGDTFEPCKNCPTCNRVRVAAWRLANKARWNEIQQASKQKRKPPNFCKVCGVSIVHRNASARYCSDMCKVRARRPNRPPIRTCRICGISMPHRFAKALYCSKACSNIAYRMARHRRKNASTTAGT